MEAWLSRRLDSASCSGIMNRKFGGSAMLVLVGMKDPDDLVEDMVSNAFFLSFLLFVLSPCTFSPGAGGVEGPGLL